MKSEKWPYSSGKRLGKYSYPLGCTWDRHINLQPPKTNNNWHLKIDGWNVEISLFWGLFGLFSVAKWLLVSCREGSNLPPPRKRKHHINPTYHINTNVITAWIHAASFPHADAASGSELGSDLDDPEETAGRLSWRVMANQRFVKHFPPKKKYIATSHEFSPQKVADKGKWDPLFQGNLGWWNMFLLARQNHMELWKKYPTIWRCNFFSYWRLVKMLRALPLKIHGWNVVQISVLGFDKFSGANCSF